MKLLKKSEVATQAAEIRRQQISEGQELIKRIGALREALGSLDKQQKDFIGKSREELNRETTELYSQRETLKAEVESLTTIKAELEKPLNEKWQEVRQAETQLTTDRERFLVEKLAFDQKQTDLDRKDSIVENRLEQLAILESELNIRNEHSIKANAEAEQILREARTKAQKVETVMTRRLKEVDRQEHALEFEKKGVAQVKKLQAEKEKELELWERQLNDKQQTQLRNDQRSKKG